MKTETYYLFPRSQEDAYSWSEIKVQGVLVPKFFIPKKKDNTSQMDHLAENYT